jgi:mRNA-degrading endonuclease toxin of MazEF toxin-antitoxin module
VARVIPQRGEIWLADLGRVQKVRPVLVLSIAYKMTSVLLSLL